MKALSIIQPWATLAVCGAKQYETRSWSTKYRGQLAIHASAKPAKWGICTFDDPRMLLELLDALQERDIVPENMPKPAICGHIMEPGVLPIGAVIGTAELVDVHRITKEFSGWLTERERAFGDYTIGRYAWELANPVLFDKPIPARGAQGLWNWEGEYGA